MPTDRVSADGTRATRLGVFDSGIGGLTVLAELRRALPRVELLYLGDTARLPYGNKSAATVLRYTERNVAFLAAQGVEGVVVACNSASALALQDLEASVPCWGVVEPGARAAARVARRRVGVIATTGTVSSGAYQRAVAELRPELAIEAVACPLFVALVEEGWYDDPITLAVAERYLAPMVDHGVDTLVLGCTHYPLLRPAIEQVMGPEVRLVDSAVEVTREVCEHLGSRVAASAGEGTAAVHLWVTDRTPEFERLSQAILGDGAHLKQVDVVAV